MERNFIRWQTITIAQLGYTTNVVLGLAVASLGFAFSLLRSNDFTPQCWSKCFFTLSLFALLVPVGSGIYCALNRLCDSPKDGEDRSNGGTGGARSE